MTDIIIHAFFENSTDLDGEPGLSPTVDVRSIAKLDLTNTLVVNDQAMTEIGGGLYAYRYTGADLGLNDYPAVAKTTSADVVSKQVPALRWSDSADVVWDETLTAATHNVATSAGRRLRDVASSVIITGTSPNTAGTANTSTRIELDNDASAVDGAYDPAVINIVGGTGAGQSRQIFEYDGSNKYAYVNRDWKVTPDDTSEYVIASNSGNTHVNEGVSQGVGSGNNTILLNALASSVDDTYLKQVIFLVAGAGADQAGIVTDYDGATKEATFRDDWVTAPDATTIYAMLPQQVLAAVLSVSATEAEDLANNNLSIHQSYRFDDQTVTSDTTDALDTATQIILGIKQSIKDEGDLNYIVKLEESVGLTALNQAVYATAADGSLTLTGSSGAWILTPILEMDATDLLTFFGTYPLEIKAIYADGSTTYYTGGSAAINRRVVRDVD